MGEDFIVSELSIIELKELVNSYERLTKSKNDKIRKKAEKTLLKLLDLTDKAIKNGIMTGSHYYQKLMLKLGEIDRRHKEGNK